MWRDSLHVRLVAESRLEAIAWEHAAMAARIRAFRCGYPIPLAPSEAHADAVLCTVYVKMLGGSDSGAYMSDIYVWRDGRSIISSFRGNGLSAG